MFYGAILNSSIAIAIKGFGGGQLFTIGLRIVGGIKARQGGYFHGGGGYGVVPIRDLFGLATCLVLLVGGCTFGAYGSRARFNVSVVACGGGFRGGRSLAGLGSLGLSYGSGGG